MFGRTVFMFAALAAVSGAHAGTPAPFALRLSAAGPDQLQSAAAAPGGGFFVAGFAAQTVGGQRFVAVLKLDANGALNPSFGIGGYASTPLLFAGGNDEIDIVVQNGLPVVSATVSSALIPGDRDIAVIRLDADGDLDPVFGDAGVRQINLNDAFDNGSQLVGFDSVRGLALGDDGALYLHGLQRGEGTASGGGLRTDTDFVVVKLTADGDPTTWAGGDGKHLLDIAESNATPRNLLALPGGAVIAAGYASTPQVGNTVQPVIYRLAPQAGLDAGFAMGGIFHEQVLAIQAEPYAIVRQGDYIVATGYGRDAGAVNDALAFRATVGTFARDLDWGGIIGGTVMVDVSGLQLGNNMRTAVALPDGRTLIAGSIGPANMPAQDAAFVVLDDAGKLDTTIEPDGLRTMPFGSNGNDQFWGAAYNAGKALLVGYKGGGMAQDATTNDDGWALLLDVALPAEIFASGFE